MNPYILTLGANLSFAIGSQAYTHFGKRFGSLWVNSFKAFIALIGFSLTVLLFENLHLPTNYSLALLLLSGIIGLGIGDTFLVNAFVDIGPGRTLVLFGFQPIVLGVLGNIFLGQAISTHKFLGIIFCILCVLTFSYENMKKSGHWNFKGITNAFLGMSFDAVGLLLTRLAFENDSLLTSMQGNIYRILGAFLTYVILGLFIGKINLISNFYKITRNQKLLVIMGSFLGTFISLALYLKAIQIGNLATISAISITGTLFSAIFECILGKHWPSKYLIVAFIFFLFGMYFVLIK